MFELLLKEMLESLIEKTDKAITEDIAPMIIENIDTVHSHPILRNNNAFIITKIVDEDTGREDIKIIYCKSHELEFEKEPVQISLTKISELIKEKCRKVMEGDETPINIDLEDYQN